MQVVLHEHLAILDLDWIQDDTKRRRKKKKKKRRRRKKKKEETISKINKKQRPKVVAQPHRHHPHFCTQSKNRILQENDVTSNHPSPQFWP